MINKVHVKTGDTVVVLSGKERGKKGKVMAVSPKEGKVIVEKINMVSKHTKPNAQNQNGGIVRMEAPINVSNVMYVHKGKATKIGYKLENGKKSRVAKSTGEVID